MVKKFNDFLNEEVSANGFSLGARDAADTAKNINSIFIQRSGWFSRRHAGVSSRLVAKSLQHPCQSVRED